VTGLSPGVFELLKNGAVEHPEFTVNESGAVSWTASPGAYSLRQVRAVPRSIHILTPSRLPDTPAGTSFFFRVDAVGGKGSFDWNLIAGNLPPGLTLSRDGYITGTPTTEGEFPFTLEVSDQSQPAQRASAEFSMAVVPPSPPVFQILTESLPDGFVGEAYWFPLEFSGGAAPYRCSMSGLPEGLTLSEDGVISGTPVWAGSEMPVNIECQDSSMPFRTAAATLTITIYDAGTMPGTEGFR
jgi:hypothetical protein